MNQVRLEALKAFGHNTVGTHAGGDVFYTTRELADQLLKAKVVKEIPEPKEPADDAGSFDTSHGGEATQQ